MIKEGGQVHPKRLDECGYRGANGDMADLLKGWRAQIFEILTEIPPVLYSMLSEEWRIGYIF